MVRLSLMLTFLGFLFFLLYSILLDGLERKIKARIQSRRGPPITQTFYDLIKLFRKELVVSTTTSSLYILAPIISFSMLLIALIILPYGFPNPLGFFGDLILLVYLIVASTIILLYGGASSGNPYAEIGCSREISLLMANELVIALVIASIAVKYHALSLNTIISLFNLTPSTILIVITLSIYVYVESIRLPFDIGEAEPEIASGYLIEYSGPLLGFAVYTRVLKRILLYILLSTLLLSLIDDVVKLQSITFRFISLVLLVTVLSIIYATVSNVYGRFRVRHAVNTVRTILIIPLVAILLSFIGL